MFYEKSGNLRNLPASDKQLNRWVLAQKKAYRQGKLREMQIKKLNDIGMEW